MRSQPMPALGEIYWIDGDGWSVAHAVSPPWIRAQKTVCGRRVPPGRDPNPHLRRCGRCASLIGVHRSPPPGAPPPASTDGDQ